jgi:hypothetical protein
VVRNNEIGIALLRGALQNPIVVRIGGHDLQRGSWRNDLATCAILEFVVESGPRANGGPCAVPWPVPESSEVILAGSTAR